MELYGRRSDGALVTYSGMTQESVTAMLADQGLTCEFLSKENYDAAMEATKQ